MDFAHPLGEGGAAEVFRCTTPAGDPRIFKQYNADSLERLDADALRHLIEWPTTHLDADDRTHLQTLCAWPEAIVTTKNKVVGILMPEAPAKFFITRKERPKPRHFSRVAVKQDRAAKGGYPYYDFPQKIARLGSLLSALQFLHSAKVVIGDLQWNNILTTGTEPYNAATSAEVYFVDCDSFIIDARAPLTNMDPMSWRPPYPTSGFSAITDMYKFALMVIRCLSEQTNKDTVDYSLYKHLLPSSDFAKLHSLLTSPDPGLTSGNLGALARAWQTSVKRDGRMYRRTDSAAREPWTGAMRKAHLAGLPTSMSSPHRSTSTSASKSASAWKSTGPSAQTTPFRPVPRADSPDAPTDSARKGWQVAAMVAVLVVFVLFIIAFMSGNSQNRSSSTTTSTLGITPTSTVAPALSSASSGYPSRSVTPPPSSIPPSPDPLPIGGSGSGDALAMEF